MKSTTRLRALAPLSLLLPACEAVRRQAGGMVPDLPFDGVRAVQPYPRSGLVHTALWETRSSQLGQGEAAEIATEEGVERTSHGRDWIADFFRGEDAAVLNAPVQFGLDELDDEGLDALSAHTSWIDGDPFTPGDLATSSSAESATRSVKVSEEHRAGAPAFNFDQLAAEASAAMASWAPARMLMDAVRRGHATSDGDARFGASGARFAADYELLDDVLGTGFSGSIHEARDRRTGTHVAVKSYRIRELSERHMHNLEREVDVHSAMKHPHIVDLEGVYKTSGRVHLVTEKLRGGELYDRLVDHGRFSEEESAVVLVQLLQAVNYMHSQGVMHRDINLENIMYSKKGGDEVKLIDFGFATKFDRHQKLEQVCGTMPYFAPEVLNGQGYDEKADLWSLGIVAYELLTNSAPFSKANQAEFKSHVLHGEVEWCEHFTALSPGAQEFVRGLLRMDPARRFSAEQALQHSWLRQHVPEEVARGLAESATRRAEATVSGPSSAPSPPSLPRLSSPRVGIPFHP